MCIVLTISETNKNGNTELKLGPYFKGIISTLGAFFLIFCVLFLVVTLVYASNDWYAASINSIVLLVFNAIFLNLFLGFEGVEFDLEKRLFRKYVKRLGIKIGSWKSMKDYTLLCLSAQYNEISKNSILSRSTVQKERSLEINLASPEKKHKSILLTECKNYKEAQENLAELNSFLNLEIKDFVKEQYAKPFRRK